MKTYDGKSAYVYAHWKRDGHCVVMKKDAFGDVRFFSRHPYDITDKMKHLGAYASCVRWVPPGTTITGELWVPGRKASAVITALNEKDPALTWEPFQVDTAPPESTLSSIRALLSLWGLPFIPYEFTVDIKDRLPKDVEGYVFKNGNLLVVGKWKPVRTIDLIINGYKDGRGKNLGLVGSLECKTVEGHVVASVSGMTDEERWDMTMKEDTNLGRVVEVEYQYVGAGGRLRHPRFVRFRDDKQPAECNTSQDPELEEYYRESDED